LKCQTYVRQRRCIVRFDTQNLLQCHDGFIQVPSSRQSGCKGSKSCNQCGIVNGGLPVFFYGFIEIAFISEGTSSR
jgi:hypothetical protein